KIFKHNISFDGKSSWVEFLRLCTKNTSWALIERPYSCTPQAVGAVYDRLGFFVQSQFLQSTDHVSAPGIPPVDCIEGRWFRDEPSQMLTSGRSKTASRRCIFSTLDISSSYRCVSSSRS